MELPGFVGGVLLLLLSGCANTSQPPSANAPEPTLPKPPSSPAAPSAAPKPKAVAAIDALAASIERDAKANPKAARFFTGFLRGEGADDSRLNWVEFATKKQQENDTVGGWPDTWTTVERTKKGQIYARSERGMTSGVGWREISEYYFREDGTLAKLVFFESVNVSAPGRELAQYYNAKGKLLYSLTDSRKGKASELSPKVYHRVSALPVYHWLKEPMPKR